MWTYIIKRLLLIIPTLIGIQTLMFFISEYVPGGPLDQLYAKLEGKQGMGGGAGEVSGTSDPRKGKKGRIDPMQELRLKRTLGLNRNRGERYLRMLLWFSPDSFMSSGEIAPGTTQKARIGDTNVIVLRTNDDVYYAYENSVTATITRAKIETIDGTAREVTVQKEETGEVVYDKDANLLRSALDNTLTFDPVTGKQVEGDMQLKSIDIDLKEEVFYSQRLKRNSEREAFTETRMELYVNESFASKLTNWNNWHGYFLLKFPRSDSYNKKSLTLIRERLHISATLGISSFFLTYIGCILLGILKAVRHGTRFDSWTSALVLLGYSIPGFVLAVFFLKMFGPGDESYFHLIPLRGICSPPEIFDALSTTGKILDYLHHVVAPVICLTIGSFAAMTFLTKNSILEQFNQLYIVAARARGLSERKVLFKHVLRNSLIPLVTGFPASVLFMFLGGSLLIEQIFSLDGIGLLSFKAVLSRDFPLIMSNLFVFTLIGLFCRLLTDICYVIVDPRISFEESKS